MVPIAERQLFKNKAARSATISTSASPIDAVVRCRLCVPSQSRGERTVDPAARGRTAETARRHRGTRAEPYNNFSLCQESLSISQLLQSSYSRHSFRRFSSLALESGFICCLHTLRDWSVGWLFCWPRDIWPTGFGGMRYSRSCCCPLLA